MLPFVFNAVILCSVPLALGALAFHPEWIVIVLFASLRWIPDYFEWVARRTFEQLGIELQKLFDYPPPAAEVLPPMLAPVKLGNHSDSVLLHMQSQLQSLTATQSSLQTALGRKDDQIWWTLCCALGTATIALWRR